MNEAIAGRLAQWDTEETGRRIWAHDPTVWGNENTPEITNRLGWLHLPEAMADKIGTWAEFADTIRDACFSNVLLLGMGGSSLAPEMFQSIFGNSEGSPELRVLDSTHPAAVETAANELDLLSTLFVVSSKSGGTLETLSLFRYFYDRVGSMIEDPGSRFVAITDPGSGLEKLAEGRGFRRVFNAPADVGGRYSALCDFGMLPASLIGADVTAVLGSAKRMAEACGPNVRAADNPGLLLGAWLGESAASGKDKLTILCSESLQALPGWLEQLIAESTGKLGKGIVPIAGEPVGPPSSYGADRVFLTYHLAGDPPVEGLADLVAAGMDITSFELAVPTDLGAEMFRAEFAVAAAGAAMGLNPFDQPDVEAAKISANALMRGGTSAGSELPTGDLASALALVREGDTVALQAYVAGDVATLEALSEMQREIRTATGAAVTAGVGPRFLHSTGQLHKGGSQALVAIQFVSSHHEELDVPETDISFGQIITAQAQGDAEVLIERGMRFVRIVVDGALPTVK